MNAPLSAVNAPFDAHAWVSGSVILGARLASCSRCGTLRVTEDDRPVIFIRRERDEKARVLEAAPPCVTPRPYVPPPW